MNSYELNLILLFISIIIVIIAILIVLAYFSLTIPVLIDIGFKALRNLPRDLRSLFCFLRITFMVNSWKYFDKSLDQLFAQNVKKNENKIAIHFKDEKWTFGELNHFSNKTANCFNDLGFVENDEICLMMNNRPEYVGILMGFFKIGVVPSLLNTNNKLDLLLNAINAINCKAIVFENCFYETIAEIRPQLSESSPQIKYFCFGDIDENNNRNAIKFEFIHKMIDSYESTKHTLMNSAVKRHFDSILCYMYTSGTTGFAKAAIIKNYRYLTLEAGAKCLLSVRDKDVIYITLPLYHMSSFATFGLALIHGHTMVLKTKFSATDFWSDCIAYKCTMANYVGEMCRYLLAQPVRDCERKHRLRMMFGIGLRPKIWHDFQQRFNVKLIIEFYASTEGNTNLANITGREGACGFYPYYWGIFVRLFYPLAIIKVDETGEVVRQRNGLCVAVSPGEVGEIVGKIVSYNPMTHFNGYVDTSDTQKKIITNVFRKGDKAFLSGDLMHMDSNGYLTFADRTGDTFRWKGENVSTADVECVIQKITRLSDCVVFGVTVTGYEGKAGMAVIAALEEHIDWKRWSDEITSQLSSYAIPLFIRLTERIEKTGSYKLMKYNYVRSGYSSQLTTDCIYFYDKAIKTYVLMDSKLHEDINCGKIRL